MSKSSIGTEPVYDARTLGKPRMFILGLQHMFAMFGATVLVPALSGLDVATTLLFAGIGTLLFHLLTKGKVPAFLGSSFAFIGGYNAVRTIGTNADGFAIYNNDLLAYACFGVAIAGLMYIILSTLFKIFGVKKVMRYFPPIVTGPIIIAIFRHHQLPCQLARRRRCDPDRHRLQHVGQGHGQDHPDPARRARLLHLRTHR